MKRVIFSFFASLLISFSGAQMLPDSVEYFAQDGPSYQSIPKKTSFYVYNSEGKVLEETIRLLSQLSERWEYSYVNGELSESTLYRYNTATNAWDSHSRAATFFNASGLYSGYSEYLFNKATNDWDITMSDLYAFDSLDRVIEQLTLHRNEIMNTLDTCCRSMYTYLDSDNLPDSLTMTNWIDGEWQEVSRISELKWENGFDYRRCNINPSSAKHYDFIDGAWELSYYDSSIYVDGKIIEKYIFTENMNHIFALYSSYIYDYDGLGNRIKSEQFFYSYYLDPAGDKIFNESNKTQYVYRNTDEILQEIRTHTNYKGWESREKVLYHYPSGPSVVNTYQAPKLIYPNPLTSSQRLFVEHADQVIALELYSANGKLLRSWTEIDQQGLELNGLVAGIYFLHILGKEEKQSTQRLIIH